MTDFHYLLLNRFQFLKNNAIEEILRERAHYYLSENKANDFWIIETPEFAYKKEFFEKIKRSQFYLINKNLIQNKYFYAIISSDKSFLNWLALRIGYFENMDDNLKSQNKKVFTSTGLTGKLKPIQRNPLLSLPYHFRPLKIN